MTKKGWKTVLVSEDVYLKAKEFIEKVNREAGYRKIRSMAHLFDMAMLEYIRRREKGSG